MAGISQIINELRRRNVFRTGAAYAVGAWLLVQVADILLETFAAPAWVMRVFVIALTIGFPVVLVVAWVYEITSEGVKRTEDVAVDELIPAVAGRQVDFVIIGVLLVAIALFAADRFRWIDFGPAPPIDLRSIAVLPLDNLSGDPEQAYFTDGMTEALTAALGQIAALKVISRTSAMQYRDTDKLMPVIAGELGVDALLEGSVLRAGDQVRITLQLIHGPSDRHLWARTFERKLQDILALQREIAGTIAQDMQLSLTPSLRAKLHPAAGAVAAEPDPKAFDAYLKGRFHFNRASDEGYRAALRFYQEAIALDPTFALAHAALAGVCVTPPIRLAAIFSLDDCEEMALQAITLDDQLAEAHAALGEQRMYQWHWAGSEAAFQRAIELNPNSVTAHQRYHELLRVVMRYDEALREIRRAEELDPLNLLVRTMVGWPLMDQQRYDEALAQWHEVLEMEPRYGLAHYNKGLVYIDLGLPEKVLDSARRAAGWMGEDNPARLMLLAAGHALGGDEDAALALLAGIERDYGERMQTWIARVYLTLGREEEALAWLDKAYAIRLPQLAFGTSERGFDRLRNHPRFQAMRRNMGLP